MGESIKLSEIEIKSFRGIKNYKLETNNNSIVFCGANGTGKSSFVNAFEFLFTGEIKSLKASGVNPGNKSIIHIGDKKKDVLVKAKINKLNIKRTLKNGIEYDDELKDMLNDFENGSLLLNRKRLLSFIDATPAKRWEEAANLISFNKYDKIEKAFEGSLKSFDKQLTSKTNDLKDNTEEIEKYCEIEKVYEKKTKKQKELFNLIRKRMRAYNIHC